MARYENYKPFAYDWLPEIPEHWKTESLRRYLSLADERKENRTDLELLSVYREYGVIPKASRDDNRNVESENTSKYKVVYKNDLVINKMKLWQGSLGISQYDGFVSPAYIVAHNKFDGNLQFLNMFLRSPLVKTYYNRISYGIRVGQWDSDFYDFKQLIVPIPPKEEQDQIVRYLDWRVSSINRIIKNKKQELALTREFLDRQFRNISSENCRMVKIKHIISLEQEYIQPIAEESYRKAGMYNRGRGIFLRDECPGKELGDSKFQRIRAGRLMLSGQFAWEDAVYITTKKDEEGIVSHRYYMLKAVDIVPVEYLFAYFLSDEGLLKLNQCSHGSAGRNRPLNINEVLNLYIPVPNDTDVFTSMITTVRNFMTMQLKAKEYELLLQEYRTRLISDVVTGQKDVRDIVIPDYEPEMDNIDEDAGTDEMESEVSSDE